MNKCFICGKKVNILELEICTCEECGNIYCIKHRLECKHTKKITENKEIKKKYPEYIEIDGPAAYS